MDPALFKDVVVSRGLKYHYYLSPAGQAKWTILLVHGFPSTARDWRHVVPHFIQKGYGVLAFDILGHGDTDKPTDPAVYVPSLMSRDVVDILDAEKLEKVTAVGHDWGSKIVARLANYYPERIVGYAFLALPYMAVLPPGGFEAAMEGLNEQHGYDIWGYWPFLSADDVDEVIQAHIDSVYALVFPSDPTFFRDRIAANGALRKSLFENLQAPLPPYVSEEDKQDFIKTFRAGGFTAPTCFYKVMTTGLSARDDQQIPPERAYPPTTSPIFYGVGKLDYICTAILGRATFNSPGFQQHQITTKEYDADHWFPLSHAEELSRDLLQWVEGFKA